MVCLEVGKDPLSLLDVFCDLKNLIIIVPEICISGSYSGVNWEKTFLASESASLPENDVCLGEDDENFNRVYKIPLTKKSNDPLSCNMLYETNNIADTNVVFLHFMINEDRVSNFY